MSATTIVSVSNATRKCSNPEMARRRSGAGLVSEGVAEHKNHRVAADAAALVAIQVGELRGPNSRQRAWEPAPEAAGSPCR